jgi:hypothetical protein
VVVDLMAGSQSLMTTTEEQGLVYKYVIPMDMRRFVYMYNPQQATVVDNIEFDILLHGQR